jgi:WhiB family redox-sensing transcriptional regulator
MEWREQAECLEVDPELFFPLTVSGPSTWQTAAAVEVCNRCAVRTKCLDWALANDVHHGVWGGVSEEQRRAMRARPSMEREQQFA